jgi:hypothetical protein
MTEIPKEIIRELKYRLTLQVKTLDRIILCGIPMGLITKQDGDLPDDYFYFCLTKATRSIFAVRTLYNERFYEDAFCLIRSIYENYLSIRFMLNTNDENWANYLIKYPVGLYFGIYKFSENKNGKINYREVIDTRINSKKEIKSFGPSFKSKNTGLDLDAEIHEQLYPFLCEHTHPAIVTHGHYLDYEQGFPEYYASPSKQKEYPKVLFLANYLSNLLLLEAVKYEDLDPPNFDSTKRQIKGSYNIIDKYISNIKLDKFHKNILSRIKISMSEFEKEESMYN